MADDIVTRLFDEAFKVKHMGLISARNVMYDAADEIERLRAEMEVITKALWLVCDDASDFQANDQVSFDEHITQVMNAYIDEARRGHR